MCLMDTLIQVRGGGSTRDLSRVDLKLSSSSGVVAFILGELELCLMSICCFIVNPF